MYAAGCGVVIFYSNRSRSPQIAATANLITASWFVSLAVWRWVLPEFHALGFAIIDGALAIAFLLMSRGRWFPVPLFYLHGMLIAYGIYSMAVGSGPIWVAAFLNRAFELELVYVLSCALFRISKLGGNEEGAP